ncbi:MAG: hypothetical protein H0Z18_10615 [Thermococcus sp.]|uniref:hypothetical protein n=1 Tax=Thermococcus sp. TaxID=35749 RepID=UPI001D311326|nr:hypothetical protein [Thermococcus sp.]MBO8175698.1 hypothetical protein [Thermococcus sp.]
MEIIKPEDCFEKVHQLWEFVEKNPEIYKEALKAGEKIRKGNTSDIEKLVKFLVAWNPRRGYRNLREQLTENLIAIMSEFEKDHDEEKFIEKLQDILGEAVKKGRKRPKKTREIIGAIKLAHVLYPEAFPLIDNPIARGIGAKKSETLKVDEYIHFKDALDETIRKFKLDFPEREKYKRIDELLYLWYTWKEDNGKSIKKLFSDLGWEGCIELFEDFIETLQEEIKKSQQT